MKIWTLLENTSCRPDVEAEHGLSLLIETGGKRILFDAGQSDRFSRNAAAMGVDLRTVDLAVLSHGHYDHGGGLPAFLKINGTAPVYVNQNVFGAFYNGTEKYIGLAPCLREEPRLIPVGEKLEPAPGLTLYSWGSREGILPVNSYGLNVCRDGKFTPDPFDHEQYLLVEEQGKRILFSGCSHRGILNIVDWFRPDVLVGGFHFKKLDPAGAGREILAEAGQALLRYHTQYYTCHCTGTAQYVFLKTVMGDRLSYLSAGSELAL